MEAKDGSQGFDFNGIYLEVELYERIRYVMEDGREATITFESLPGGTLVKENFDAENTFSPEIQREGWQAILENFKKYTESLYPLKPLFFSITIQAPVEQVLKTMLDAQHYRDWTSVFSEGSYYEGSWRKGEKILFLTLDEKGKPSGMISLIKEHIPNRFISIEHMGVVENGKEITDGPEVAAWKGALENYTFQETKDGTEIIVTVDTEESHKDYFQKTWPQAMEKLKGICEGKQ